MEELILANPHDHLYHQRYAEVGPSHPHTLTPSHTLPQICYTQDAMETARKHYATCLKLNPDNIRALYGFCWVRTSCHGSKILLSSVCVCVCVQVCGALSRGKGRAELKTKNSRYCDWARSQLKQKYQFVSLWKLCMWFLWLTLCTAFRTVRSCV